MTVCSNLDRSRLDVGNCRVVPNGYEIPPRECVDGEPVARTGRGPVITMVGMFCYEPNIDAAKALVGGVLPSLQRRWPEVEVRLVGRTDYRLEHLRNRPGVVLRGAPSARATTLSARFRRISVRACSRTTLAAMP